MTRVAATCLDCGFRIELAAAAPLAAGSTVGYAFSERQYVEAFRALAPRVPPGARRPCSHAKVQTTPRRS